jgi:hypothetical protein
MGEPLPRYDDEAHTGVWVRAEREWAKMSRAEFVERLRTDPLYPRTDRDERWLADVEAGIGVLDLMYSDIAALGRASSPPRPEWWESGYEHDLRFAYSGRGEDTESTPELRQYWAHVITVREEIDRYNAGGDIDWRQQLRVVCRLLNAYEVAYVLIGTGAGIAHGADVKTDDLDLVPRADADNVQRLCDALNILGPRWWNPDQPEGRRIDGRHLEPRHFGTDDVGLTLRTRLGDIDVVMRPRGFEEGYAALAPGMVTRVDEGVELHLASLDDVITSKELLDRPKDRRQLPALYRVRDT